MDHDLKIDSLKGTRRIRKPDPDPPKGTHLYMASDLYLNTWSCWNTERGTSSTGKPVSILRGKAKKCRPFWY